MNEIDPENDSLVQARLGAVSRHAGAVSWAAVFAGGVGAAAFSLILLTLGTGLGLASISPWRSSGASAKAFGIASIVWVCVTQIMASGLGGYLAGRLRSRWPYADADEVYFRDTAHGFLSWSIATLATAAVLASAIPALLSTGGRVAGPGGAETNVMTKATLALERGNADAMLNTWPVGYFVDSLFRQPASAMQATQGTQRTPDHVAKVEAARIFLNSAASGNPLSSDDAAYMSRLIAQQTGLAEPDALARVNTTYGRLQDKINALDTAEKQAADVARKASVFASLWLFIALLMGAFSASLMAIYGGRLRDL